MSKGHFHINPFRPRKVLKSGEESNEAIEKEEPMTWTEAAKLCLIITVFELFVGFFTVHTYDDYLADSTRFFWDLAVFAGGTFFTQFIAITGISRYYAKKN